jgi:hypothetical protein
MKNILKIIYVGIMMIVLLLCAVSCKKDAAEDTSVFKVQTTDFIADDFFAKDYAIKIWTPYDWTAASDAEWLTVTKASGKEGVSFVEFSTSENTVTSAREANITITSGGKNIVVKVTQNGLLETPFKGEGWTFNFTDIMGWYVAGGGNVSIDENLGYNYSKHYYTLDNWVAEEMSPFPYRLYHTFGEDTAMKFKAGEILGPFEDEADGTIYEMVSAIFLFSPPSTLYYCPWSLSSLTEISFGISPDGKYLAPPETIKIDDVDYYVGIGSMLTIEGELAAYWDLFMLPSLTRATTTAPSAFPNKIKREKNININKSDLIDITNLPRIKKR